MTKIKLFCATVIFIVWGLYYLNFGLTGSISDKTDVWGQFGDYVGGVVNPILSFITIYLLINSISLQRDANKSLLDEIQRQEQLEKYKKYESRLFRLIESQETCFSRLRIVLDANDNIAYQDNTNDTNVNQHTVIEYKSGAAVTYIEDSLSVLTQANTSVSDIISWLNDIDADDHFFSVARRFYLIIKLIDDNSEEEDKDGQYEMLINLTDVKVIGLIAILSMYYNWDIMEYIKNSKILKKDGIKEYIDMYKGKKITAP
ncbi:hypothetical protein OU748_003620 [Yersinia enterocolitica]|uniref:hypothetical protein n=1 Tax=Yersinia TaxID=629 RepID=UPI0005DE7646|nr:MULTISPECIES: hypothetical protein [Yersinia]EKN3755923.1 hypothetical protein [Yersinia enterocolitica]EKN3797254.1 hypothetical protein [Yersinia enterocolitica]EKN3878056.1 hypothetical protein [Yersinia enterocolitica]EKN4175568.1 hypothetical protein [Yersinia enterocolitica]ELY5229065.1 hypothetical protein [Yersinia enterocolitica]